MEIKGSSLNSWDWRGEKETGILPRNSTLDEKEREGDGGETSGSKHGKAGGGES